MDCYRVRFPTVCSLNSTSDQTVIGRSKPTKWLGASSRASGVGEEAGGGHEE
jgi:hypothetical protein